MDGVVRVTDGVGGSAAPGTIHAQAHRLVDSLPADRLARWLWVMEGDGATDEGHRAAWLMCGFVTHPEAPPFYAVEFWRFLQRRRFADLPLGRLLDLVEVRSLRRGE